MIGQMLSQYRILEKLRQKDASPPAVWRGGQVGEGSRGSSSPREIKQQRVEKNFKIALSHGVKSSRYKAKGQNVEATLVLPQTPKKVVKSNFLEEEKEPLQFNKNMLKVETRKNAVVTVKVIF